MNYIKLCLVKALLNSMVQIFDINKRNNNLNMKPSPELGEMNSLVVLQFGKESRRDERRKGWTSDEKGVRKVVRDLFLSLSPQIKSP